MNHDIDIKKVRINCFRQSKVDGEFMLQMRVPGAIFAAKHLALIQELCETLGNGEFHIGTRQTMNVPGIKYEDIPKVNKMIKKYIKDIEVEECGVDMRIDDNGYPTIGERNTMSCIGSRHCIKANIDSPTLAKKLEKEIFPSDYHIKISVAGCPNDCSKAHYNDFGLIGQTRPEYNYERCIGCGACVRKCKAVATGVLTKVNGKIEKDWCCCIGCGECVLACPVAAWTRSKTKYYRIMIGGRTGKQTPRMGKTFVNWATEEDVFAIIRNWQNFSSWVMDGKPIYIHGGHLIDRAGYTEFKKRILEGVTLNPKATVAERILWSELEYKGQINLRPIGDHKKAGPK